MVETPMDAAELLDAVGTGLCLVGAGGLIVQVNTAAARLLGEPRAALDGQLLYSRIAEPDQARVAAWLRDEAGRGRLRVRIETGGDEPRRAVELTVAPAAVGAGQRAVLLTEVTDQAVALAALEERVAAQQEEIATLVDVAHDLSGTLELGPLLERVFVQLKRVADYAGAAIMTFEDDRLVVLAHRTPDSRPGVPGHRLPPAPPDGQATLMDIVLHREPVIVADVRDDSVYAQSYRLAVGAHFETTFSYVRSWLGVPLVANDRVVGMLGLSHGTPGFYTPGHAELAPAIARQAAAAIVNARLYERAQAVGALTRVAASLTVNQPLETALQTLAASVVQSTTALACSVVLIDERTGLARVSGAHGLPEGYVAAMEQSWRSGANSPTVASFRERTTVAVWDQPKWALADPLFAPCHAYLRVAEWDKAFVIPIIYHDRSLGAINVYYRPQHQLTPEEERLLYVIADQAAVAVENARLYREAQSRAALGERQRLARELHDSVTQALFSTTLHVRAAQLAFAQAGLDPTGPLGRSIDQLRALTQGALAEMRALIFELRPEALAEEGLVAALTKQAAAFTAREGLAIEVRGPEQRLPLEPGIEEHLYRLTLEALHNTIKHARAARAWVRIQWQDGAAELMLEAGDDGAGFDPALPHPGHLGLSTMAERAAQIGGRLAIESAPGTGTMVRLRLPLSTTYAESLTGEE